MEKVNRGKQYWSVFVDFPLLLVIGIPIAIVAYLWMHVKAGWALGEFSFDPGAFMRRYGKEGRFCEAKE